MQEQGSEGSTVENEEQTEETKKFSIENLKTLVINK